MISRIRLLPAVALAALMILPSLASAQDWPSRNVKFLVPLGPSSGADITARLLAERLQAKWGQPVTVENRAGGDGIVGITAFLTANDDHTLFFGPTATYTAHPYTRASVPYNANDIIPIVRTSVTVVTVAVPTALGVNSLKELVDLAKKQPGKLNWAAVTGLNEYQFMAFVKSAGVDMVRVPYRDLNQAVTDLSEGRIQAYSSAYATARATVEGGKIKLLALTNTTRAPMLPGIPTSREAGYPALEFDGLVGIHGTPVVQASARQRIEKDVLDVLKDKAISDRLTATGTVVAPGTTAEFVAAIATQKTVAAQTAKFLDLKPAQQ
jgi:tripartite-type tricarboxylate transporter receptor subunit TctC